MTGRYFETAESVEWDRRAAVAGEQFERAVAEATSSDDPMRRNSGRFAPAPAGEPEDEAVTAIARWLRPDSVLVDVGCGGGRLAAPLASHCGRVIGVEPSPGMLAELRRHVEERGIGNIRAVQSTWEEWEEESVDAVLFAHLLYGARPIIPWLEKAERVARERIFVLLSTAQPVAYYHPLWKAVYGEEREPSNGANEFHALLGSWRIEPEVVTMAPTPPRPFRDADSAIVRAAARLAIDEESAVYVRLGDAVRESLVETDGGGYLFSWGGEIVPYLFSWDSARG